MLFDYSREPHSDIALWIRKVLLVVNVSVWGSTLDDFPCVMSRSDNLLA